MKKVMLTILVPTILFSCAPVIKKEVINAASRTVSFSEIRKHPELYKGRLFILGGIIIETKVTKAGSLIEAIYVTVDRRGYLQDIELSSNRFLALYPKQQQLLDPLIYRKGREITIAAELVETRSGKIDEIEYIYPLFEIKELYLWKERAYYIAPPYPSWYYPYWWNDPWYRYYYPRPYYW